VGLEAAAQRPQLEAAVGAVNSGPLGANSVPATITLPNGHVQPFNPLKHVAFHALSSAYSVGCLVCGLSALVAALIAAFALGGRRPSWKPSNALVASAPQNVMLTRR